MIENVTAAKCLEFAIKAEEVGAELYQALARRFAADAELRGLFEALGRDELQHGELFRGLHQRAASRAAAAPLSSEQQDYLRAMALSEVFAGKKGIAENLDGIATRDDALERALNLEKATLAYYQAVRDVIGADEALDMLISVEKRHVVLVMQLLLTGAKFRGLADSF
jgi:rubrerythrin